jgi:23S rRNA (adenine2503-C2)-methyltransferase
MINIKSLTKKQVVQYFIDIGEKTFKGKQVFKWLWQKYVLDFDEMTDISKKLREKLKSEFVIEYPKILKKQISKDGTIKYLLELNDGVTIETVWIPSGRRNTICISTQAGCAMGCKFCYTAKQELIRNLAFFEIVDQIVIIMKDLKKRPTNIVTMGMGEPLKNLKNLEEAIEIINDEIGIGIAARKITVSTVGFVPGIYELAKYPKQIKLSVSLNATNDKIRDYIMPINKIYPIEKLLYSVKHFIKVKRKRVTFEYVLIKGVNDSKDDADRLIELTKDIECKINIIPLNISINDIDSPFKPIDSKTVEIFTKWMMKGHKAVTIRKSKGRDIDAACGELRIEVEGKNGKG